MSFYALSEMERDALTELVNIGVSRAAVGLRQMLNQPVILSVPAIEIVNHLQAAEILGQRESETLVSVRQDFSGAFSGQALLIFPHSSSIALVKNLLGDDIAPDDLAELENDALAETGNVLLNGCLGSMANMLNGTLRLATPTVVRGSSRSLFEVDTVEEAEGIVLVLYINFSVDSRAIRGYLALLMDMESLDSLRRLIAKFIAKVIGDIPALAPADHPG